jgi:predicted  nucleic acid-binding Zn-ribbon protein
MRKAHLKFGNKMTKKLKTAKKQSVESLLKQEIRVLKKQVKVLANSLIKLEKNQQKDKEKIDLLSEKVLVLKEDVKTLNRTTNPSFLYSD